MAAVRVRRFPCSAVPLAGTGLVPVLAGICLLLGAIYMQAAEDKKPLDLDGSWQCQSASVNGKPLPAATVQQLHLTLSGGRYKTDKGGEVLFDSTYSVDRTKQPAQINMIGTEGELKGRQAEGIFSLNGETLTICYTMPGGKRPTVFESAAGSGAYLIVWRRAD